MKNIVLITLLTLMTFPTQAKWTSEKEPNFTEKTYLDLFAVIIEHSKKLDINLKNKNAAMTDADFLIKGNGDTVYRQFHLCQSMVQINNRNYRDCGGNFNKAVNRFMELYESRSLDEQTGASERALDFALKSITHGSKKIRKSQKENKGNSSHGIEWVIPASN